jgi:hypothetical protein
MSKKKDTLTNVNDAANFGLRTKVELEILRYAPDAKVQDGTSRYQVVVAARSERLRIYVGY